MLGDGGDGGFGGGLRDHAEAERVGDAAQEQQALVAEALKRVRRGARLEGAATQEARARLMRGGSGRDQVGLVLDGAGAEHERPLVVADGAGADRRGHGDGAARGGDARRRIVGGEHRLDGVERGEARARGVVEGRVRADDLERQPPGAAHAPAGRARARQRRLDGARVGGRGVAAQEHDHRSASTTAQTANAIDT